MSIGQHIEELRAELRNTVYADERREIEAALEMALAEREIIWAELDGSVSAEPPFQEGFCRSLPREASRLLPRFTQLVGCKNAANAVLYK